MKSTAAITKRRFRADIQGLRAIAVLAVVLYHANVPFLDGGYVGVDVFFVISGFLITTHLLDDLQRNGRVNFSQFYARRVRRILPASFVVLVLSVSAAVIWLPPLLMEEMWRGAVATAFYVPNYLFALEGTNYLAEASPSLFQHYWSLGVEEQFYLLWPVIVMLCFRAFKHRLGVLFWSMLLLVTSSYLACILLTFTRQSWAFFSLPTRAWELGVGALAAILLIWRPQILRGVVAAIAGWIGLAGISCSVLVFTHETPFPGYLAALPVLSTALVIVSGEGSAKYSPERLLSVRPIMMVGLISYSLYLVHWPLVVLPQAAAGFQRPLPLSITLLLALMSVPLAWLMYRFVEEPGRTGTWLNNARPRRSLLAALVASVVATALATGVLAWSNSRGLYTSETVGTYAVSAPPVFTTFVPRDMRPGLRDVSVDQPVTYADGCHLDFEATASRGCVYGDENSPKIVLFGDSHAAHWFPALQSFTEEHGYALVNRTKSSCPSVSVDVFRDGIPYRECDAWRSSVLDEIRETNPALVIIANYGNASVDVQGSHYSSVWGQGLGATLDAISSPVVVLSDTPNMRSTPSVCLSANLEDASVCGTKRHDALASPARDAEVSTASARQVPYIDLTDYFCSDRCDPIAGNVLIYRDAHHLTATFSRQMSNALGLALSESL